MSKKVCIVCSEEYPPEELICPKDGSSLSPPVEGTPQPPVPDQAAAVSKKICITCHQEFSGDESACPIDGSILSPIKTDRYIGTMLAGRYDILEVIGGGGMGLVYKARHVMMNRVVAIKMLHQHLTNSPEALKRFQLEAQAASCLSLPNILTIYDFGVTDEGQPYMVMDYLEGTSLADVLEKERRLSVLRSLNIFMQGCAGLAHAHQKGVLHRDLKPSNIMLVNYGEDQADFVKIVDFGIAKLLNRTGESSGNLTRTGEVYGSPLYMSPEQCRGQELDQRSDLYSFGCVMYKTLTGLPVFSGSEVIELLFKQVSEMPLSFSEACPDAYLPSELEEIVFKALAKNPDHRFASMGDLKDTLEAYKKRLEEPEDNGNDRALTGSRAGSPAMAMGPLAASLAAKAHAPAAASTTKAVANHAPAAPAAPKMPVMPPAPNLPALAAQASAAPSIEANGTAPLPVSHAAELRPVQMHSAHSPSSANPMHANAASAQSPEEAPFSALMKVANEGAKDNNKHPHPEETLPLPASAASHPSKMRGTSKPEWVIILESTFANKLVLVSVVGLIVASVAVAILAVNAEKTSHRTIAAPSTVRPAPINNATLTQPLTPQPSQESQPAVKSPATVAVETSPTDPADTKSTTRANHHHSRSHHPASRRHAYSSYGF